MSGDRCLVTGATGFIGDHLTRRLLADGYEVRCLVRSSSDTSRLQSLDVELAVGNLADRGSLARAVDGCRFVVHCGALVSDWATVSEIAAINVAGTRNVLEASRAASVERFLHFSSTDVYGHPGGRGIDENQPRGRFANWYSETKRAAEEVVQGSGNTNAIEVVILRPATVYGPGSTDVVGEMARAITAGHMLLIDRGRAIAGLSYVDNVVDAALLALRSAAARGEAFNITDGLEITWSQFLCDLAEGLGCPAPRWSLPHAVARGLGFSLEHGYRWLRTITGLSAAPLLSRQAVDVLGRNQDFSNRKARELLGWEPRRSYAEGLEATLAWLRDEFPPTARSTGKHSK